MCIAGMYVPRCRRVYKALLCIAGMYNSSKMPQGLQGFTVYSRDVQQFQDAAGVYKALLCIAGMYNSSKMSQGLQGFTVYSRDVQQFQDAAGFTRLYCV